MAKEKFMGLMVCFKFLMKKHESTDKFFEKTTNKVQTTQIFFSQKQVLHVVKEMAVPIRGICFDFDGVLAASWTQPAMIFPQVRALLQTLTRIYKVPLAVVSFNSVAWDILCTNDLGQYFSAVRCGSQVAWDFEASSEISIICNSATQELSKTMQIKSILSKEWKGLKCDSQSILLVDDNIMNITKAKHEGFSVVHVEDAYLGASWSAIWQYLPPELEVKIPIVWQQNLLMPRSRDEILVRKLDIARHFFSAMPTFVHTNQGLDGLAAIVFGANQTSLTRGEKRNDVTAAKPTSIADVAAQLMELTHNAKDNAKANALS